MIIRTYDDNSKNIEKLPFKTGNLPYRNAERCDEVSKYKCPYVEVSTDWVFIPRLPWTFAGFVTHCQQFVNGLEINLKLTLYF